jgi:hypothetical protein
LIGESASLIFVSTFISYAVTHSTEGFTSIVDTEPAVIVTEQDHMSFTAYLLKDEKTISSNFGGGVLYLAEDAQKVNPGDELAIVYENQIDSKTYERSKEIDRYIEILENSIGDGVFTLAEAKVDEYLSKAYNDMMHAAVNGDVSVIDEGSDEFLILLNKMNAYSGNGEALKSALNEYKQKREELQSAYSGECETISTETGGYFYKSVDGYENIFNSEKIDELSYDDFIAMTEASPENTDAVGKLMLDYLWYLTVPTVKGISDTYSVGAFYDVSFPDCGDETYNMQLTRIVYDSTGAKSIMIFACGVVDKDFENVRVRQISITHRNVRGYKINTASVCEIGGNTGVYILKDGMASFRKVVILYEGDGYYIVSANHSNSDDHYVYLEMNDNVISDCRNMYEGKVIGG